MCPANVDERELPGESPAAYVARIAHAKATSVTRPGWILAADTTVTIDGRILGKAETHDEASAMMGALVGRTHQVLTAFTIIGNGIHERIVSTDVQMVACDAQTLADYIASEEWRGKAGAYAIQGIAGALVREVRGSVTNVIGLPVAEVIETLRAAGGPTPRFAAGIPA